MEIIKKIMKNTLFTDWIILISLIFVGCFNEYISCVISVLLSIFIMIKIISNKKAIIKINIITITVAIITLAYFISIFYALDSGMAFIGFLKFFPVLLFTILILQEPDSRKSIIAKIPYFAVFLGITSVIFMFIPGISVYFNVADRLAGFFQYPNTFAVFLLLGELLLVSKTNIKIYDVIFSIILFLLILITGSRTVFVLTVISNLILLCLRKGKKIKIITLSAVLVLALSVFVLYPLLAKTEIFNRLLNISLSESTFVGRLLYWQDSLPVILKNPFGIGYGGYYYIQQSIQTGVYSTKFVHNDVLQLLLDVGWLPCVMLLLTVISTLVSKRLTLSQKVIFVTLFLHSMFDFDMQFISMVFIFVIFASPDYGKEVILKKAYVSGAFTVCAAGLFSLYFSVALGLGNFGFTLESLSMYSGNTEQRINLLIEADNTEEQNKIADDIISANKYVQSAYGAKALYAFSDGDIEEMIYYKRKILEIAPFAYDEYENYCYMLIQSIYLYEQVGDEYSIKYCQDELCSVVEKVRNCRELLSDLGKKINDQPKTELPDDIMDVYYKIRG